MSKNDEAVLKEDSKTPDKAQIDKVFELPSGKKASIKKGKGRHIMQATKMAGGDPGKLVPYVMQLLVLIDGERQTIEDFEDLDMQDYMRLSTEFSELNF